MPWVDNGYGEEWVDDPVDYGNSPDLAPPGSEWNPETGGWDNAAGSPAALQGLQETFQSTPLNQQYADPGQAEQGLGYWAEQGVDPQTEMFDPNTGQLRPGWERTATGYAQTPSSPGPTMAQGPNTGTPGSGGDWFSAQLTSGGGSDFGAIPAEFSEQYTALPRPDYLQGAYEAPQWNETFSPMSMDQLSQDPGYQARMQAMQQGLERSAAAKGSILSGGFIGKAMPRQLGNLASQEYAQANDRLFNQYQQRYQAFTGNRDAGFQGRQFNENAYQGDVGNNLNQFLTRYNQYRDSVGDKRTAETDYFNRNLALGDQGLTATGILR